MSLIIKIPGVTFTDSTLPKLYRDSLINTGSLYCYDFLDAYTNSLAAGNVANGASFANLVPNKAASTVVNSAAHITNGASGLTFTGGSYAAVDFGTSFNMATAGNHSFLAVIWFKADPTLDAFYPNLMAFTTNTSGANDQFNFDLGASQSGSLMTLRGTVGDSTLQASSVAKATRHQAAVAWTPGKTSLFVDGVLVGSDTTLAGATLVNPPAGTHEGIGISSVIASAFAPFKGTVYRAYKEDLTISMAASGRTFEAQALAQVQADWAANNTRFS